MGVFDNFSSGGLLDLLRNSAQNQNLGIGLGADSAYQPMPGSTPQSPQAAPTNALVPANRPVAPASAAGSPGLGDRLLAGLTNFAHAGGPLQAVADGINGLATGQSADSYRQQALNATAQALRTRGASPDDIQAAMSNSEVLKALLAQYYGKDRFTSAVVGRDRNGQPVYGAFNAQTGEARRFGLGGPTMTAAPVNRGPRRPHSLR